MVIGKRPKKAKKKVEWTDARLKSFIVAVLRSGTRRYPPKYETLNAAKTERKTNKATGRIAQHYQCASCGGEFSLTGVQVDHLDPVVTSDGFTTWDDFIKRLYCSADNFQVLCISCHKNKSADERKARNENRTTRT